jgi:hypothetical protein
MQGREEQNFGPGVKKLVKGDKMKGRNLVVMIVLCLVLALIVTVAPDCGSNEVSPTPTQTASPTGTATPTSTPKQTYDWIITERIRRVSLNTMLRLNS